jgi:hypothetical protein
LGETELELRAARDDLSKTKASLAHKETELGSLLKEYKELKEGSRSIPQEADSTSEIAGLRKELEATADELSGTRAAFQATKESIEAMSLNHRQELEDFAKARVEEMASLHQVFELEKADLIELRSVALNRARELEIELKSGQDEHTRPQMASPINGSPGVTREELARLHEAHNLKVHSMEASHRKAILELEASLEQSLKCKEELQSAAERRDMEMHFLTTENEENADRIKRYVTYHYLFIISLATIMLYGWI